MKPIEEKCLEFVVRFYQPGRLDAERAFRHFADRYSFPVYRRFWSRSVGWAASVLAILLFSVGIYRYFNPPVLWKVFASANQVRELVLPDSTFIALAPNTSIRYDEHAFCHGAERKIELRGKAFFQVKPDAAHPFCVEDGYSRVKVLGTEFQVRSEEDKTEVWVQNGKVLFGSLSAPDNVVLTRGMAAMIKIGDKSPRLLPCYSENNIAWKTGFFVYDNTAIDIVLNELSDYYRVHLSTSDIGKRLSGRFSTQSLEEIINVIEQTLHIKIVRK